MASEQFGILLRLLRRRAGEPISGGLSDGVLLDRFVRQRDEAAFEALFWRHGPMVLAVCRRLLPPADAEDAFQATFLILVRKAASIGRREAVGAWLYRVAYRVALRARTGARPVAELPSEGPAAAPDEEAAAWRDLRPVLDEAIDSLPEKYRAPVVLCYLEGKTNQEAARELGCPKGTVAIRLKRARERLKQRLGRRGLVMPAALLGVLLASRARAEAVESVLAQTTLKAALGGAAGGTIAGAASPHAIALARGVLRAMFLRKMKLTVAFLIALGVIVGGGIWWHDDPAQAAPPQLNEEPAVRTAPGKEGRRDLVDVASRREGLVLFIGTEIPPGEKPPAGDVVTVKVGDVERKYRRLKEGDRVEEGQLLGRIEDDLARDDLAIKAAKLEAAKADRVAAEKVRDEARERLGRVDQLAKQQAITTEEVRSARFAFERSAAEAESKAAAVEVATLEKRRAERVVEMHEIRSRVRGVITKVYKHPGEGVQALEAVVQVRLEDK
jgi:RNA polymerase sigma factor (sigma-70 family)